VQQHAAIDKALQHIRTVCRVSRDQVALMLQSESARIISGSQP